MNEAYYEIMVKKKTPSSLKIAQLVAGILTVFFALISLIGMFWGMLLAIVCGVGCYFLSMYNKVEFEYLYVDKELQIDRILARSKRKRMETLDLKQFEILAPLHSHELNSYRNGKFRKVDYSSGDGVNDKSKYALVINDKMVIFEPTEEMVKTIKMFAPRNVFMY